MRCILDGIREQLLQQKQHPFFIRQNRHGNGFVDEPDFPQNELRCIFSDGLPDNAVQIILLKDKIIRLAIQP